jgi:predicted ATP-grasp superfamily ATP-dependent carboligase
MKLIIIGGNHHNTLGVIRAFGERGVTKSSLSLIIVGDNVPRYNILSASKYVKKENIRYLDKDKEIVPLLMTFVNKNTEKPVVICCSDGSALEIMSHNEDLAQFYYIPSLAVDVADMFDKGKQTIIAKTFGLNVPESSVLSNGIIKDWNLYPCITKPITSVTGAGKDDINISFSEHELQEHLKQTAANAVQIQKYIHKSLEFQLIGCSLNAGEIVIIPGFSKILRQPKNTNTGYLLYSPLNYIQINQAQIEGYLRHIGYSGLFSIEFIRAANGIDYYMEINMRNDGNAYCVTSAGVNLPYIWAYYNITGKLPDNEPLTIDKPILWIPDLSDIKIGIHEVGICRWLSQMLKADSHSVWSNRDMKKIMIRVLKH